ncbi:MAG: hypothetical protein K2N37_09740 [Lachnospiraceae bacterium]|nr:hypothetical protein [Lachnospiraceae bacterium]
MKNFWRVIITLTLTTAVLAGCGAAEKGEEKAPVEEAAETPDTGEAAETVEESAEIPATEETVREISENL